jgi:hypothetical protein
MTANGNETPCTLQVIEDYIIPSLTEGQEYLWPSRQETFTQRPAACLETLESEDIGHLPILVLLLRGSWQKNIVSFSNV